MKNIFRIAVCLALLQSCKPELQIDTPSTGEVNLSRYVAAGNSLTAGYADNSLYRSGQENSYPNILSGQFRLVGGGEFKQPLLPGEYGFPEAKMVLGMRTNCAGETGLSAVSYSGAIDTASSSSTISAFGPFNNLGVPGIRVADYLLNGYANIAYTLGNASYAKRFYKEPGKRPLDELIYTANTINPTFFSLWLGSNDVLGYATSGGGGAAPGSPVFGIILPEDISPIALFQTNYDSIVHHLVNNGAKGVLINIPDITAIPLFTTIPVRGLNLSETEAGNLNSLYAQLGLSFAAGDNLFVIEDEFAPGGKRQIMTNEYILLSSSLLDSIKCAGWGKTVPIPREDVLTIDEVNNIRNATAAFNQVIWQTAQKYKLAHVDINSYLQTVLKGIRFNGVDFNTEYISGGAFSLDGVHLTPRGNALVANEVIREINNTYLSTIPAVDVNSYMGLRFP